MPAVAYPHGRAVVNQRLKAVYDRLPPTLQSVAVSIKGWQNNRQRYSEGYESVLSEVKKRESMTSDELQTFRRERLREFMTDAKNSPFWRERFAEYGVAPTAEDPFEELSKLPVTTKADVKDAEREIVPPSFAESDLLPVQTSGTTGSGLSFVQTRRALWEKRAVWWRHRHWHSLTRDTFQGYLGGRPVVPLSQSEPPFWRYNYPNNQVVFSSFHLKPGTAPAYVDAIREKDLPWLHGYPSALALLGNLLLEQGLTPPASLKYVTIGAETLYDHQRETIEDAFDCPITYHYGLAEAVANVSHCPEGNLHVDEDFAHIEFVPHEDVDGHRIIGTNWSNPAFPLFRYDTGDIAKLADTTCPCGRHGRILEAIVGRQDDYVVLPDGARIGRLDHIFKSFESVTEAQIYQPDRSQIVFRVVPGEGFDDGIESALVDAGRTRLGTEIDIGVERVKSIDRTDAGKMKLVVSDVDNMDIETSTT